MCVVSNIGDHYGRRDEWPWRPHTPTVPRDSTIPSDFKKEWDRVIADAAKDATVASLEKRVAQLEELIRKGKEYDEKTGQPDCEIAEKRARIEKLAEELGVKISFK